MYGSVFRMRPKPGKADELRNVMMAPGRQPAGMRNAYLLREDAAGNVWGFAVFESEKAYRDNAADPAQDAEYQKFRVLLETDPEWHDGTIDTFRDGLSNA